MLALIAQLAQQYKAHAGAFFAGLLAGYAAARMGLAPAQVVAEGFGPVGAPLSQPAPANPAP